MIAGAVAEAVASSNADAERRCAEANAAAAAAERRAVEAQAAVEGAIAEAARAVDEVEGECRATVDAAHAAMEVGAAGGGGRGRKEACFVLLFLPQSLFSQRIFPLLQRPHSLFLAVFFFFLFFLSFLRTRVVPGD